MQATATHDSNNDDANVPIKPLMQSQRLHPAGVLTVNVLSPALLWRHRAQQLSITLGFYRDIKLEKPIMSMPQRFYRQLLWVNVCTRAPATAATTASTEATAATIVNFACVLSRNWHQSYSCSYSYSYSNHSDYSYSYSYSYSCSDNAKVAMQIALRVL